MLVSRLAMRLLVLACLALAAFTGCTPADAPSVQGGPGGGSGSGSDEGAGNTPAECRAAADCALAAAKCCDCPTFAVPVTDPSLAACADVSCPPSSCPDNVEAACDQGMCVLACKPLPCPQTCADGFTVDPTGCLSCACAEVTTRSCTADADCVRTRADCCGCAHGGSDTAVASADQASFDASLMCPADPVCPRVDERSEAMGGGGPAGFAGGAGGNAPRGVDTCAPDLEPRCLQGACALAPTLPPGACGRPDLPACPAGTACTLDASDAATQLGVGVCM